MARTQVGSQQLGDEQVKRSDLNVSDAGDAVIRKVIGSSNVTLSSTGADAGTGDVTVTFYPGTVTAPNSTAITWLWDTFAQVSIFDFRRANGTSASKTALASGDLIGRIGGRGYGATGYSSSARAGIGIVASEDWTDTDQGARIDFYTNGNGAATLSTRMTLDHDGTLRVGSVANQSGSMVSARAPGNNFGFGHSNTSGYGNTLGGFYSNGQGFLGFSCENSNSDNTFTTRGIAGSLLYGNLSGGFVFAAVTNTNASGQTPTTTATLNASGNFAAVGSLSAGTSVSAATSISATTSLSVGTTATIGGAASGTLGVREGSSGALVSTSFDTAFFEANGAAGITIGTPNNTTGTIAFSDPEANNSGFLQYNHSTDQLRVGAGAAEVQNWTSGTSSITGTLAVSSTGRFGGAGSGALGVRESGASSATVSSSYDGLFVENNAVTGITIGTPNNVAPAICFADPQSSTAGYIQYNHSTDAMILGTAGTGSLTLSSAGNATIAGGLAVTGATTGTTTARFGGATSGALGVREASSGVTPSSGYDGLFIENSASTGITFGTPNTSDAAICFADPQSSTAGYIKYSHASELMQFVTQTSARFDVAGFTVATFTAAATALVGSLTGTTTARFGGTTSGALGVRESGASSASVNSSYDGLFVENNAVTGITIGTPNNVAPAICFADPQSSAAGYIQYNHSTDVLNLGAAGGTQVTVGASGALGATTTTSPTVTAATQVNTPKITTTSAALSLESVNASGVVSIKTGTTPTSVADFGTTSARFLGITQGVLGVRDGGSSGATANTTYDAFVIETNGNGGMSFISPNTATVGIMWGDPEGNQQGQVTYNHSTNIMTLAADVAGTLQSLSLSSTYFRPGSDNSLALGGGSNRFSTVYAGTGTINTSDETQKTILGPIDDRLLRAVLDTELFAFQWNEAVERKGDDARIHFGPMAQRFRDACLARGVDPRRYAVYCEDPKMVPARLTRTIERPKKELVSVRKSRIVDRGGYAQVEVYYEDEERDVVRVVELVDERGVAVMADQELIQTVSFPVMETVEEEYDGEEQARDPETDELLFTYGLRMDQFDRLQSYARWLVYRGELNY